MHRKTTMAVLAVAVALLGVVAIVQTGGGVDEVDATNAGTVDELKEAFATGGDYVLSSDVAITETLTLNSDVTLNLDLNGHTISASSATFSGTSYVIDILGNFTLFDSSSTGDGSITTDVDLNVIHTGSDAVMVIQGGNVTRDSGTNQNMIQSEGELTINGGTFTLKCDNENAAPTIVSTRAGAHTVINGGTYNSDDYAFNVMGNGNYSTAADLAHTTLELNDCDVTAGVAIGTNASNGQYSGFTIEVKGGTYRAAHGLFASGYGIYTITGGHIIASVAGVQASSGIITIGGNAVIETTGSNNGVYNSLAPGGSGTGNIAGALVIGKHNQNYIGNIDVDITGGRLAAPAGSEAIVVLDKSMGVTELKEFNIDIQATGGEIDGDVTFTSTQDTDASTKGEGKIDFNLNGSSVHGDINKADTFVGDATITSGAVSGSIPQDVAKPASSGTVRFDSTGQSYTYYGSFKMPGAPGPREGDTFLGYSLIAGSTSDLYDPYQVVTTSGNVTVYEVWESDIPSYNPGYDDDEDLPPFIPTQPAEEDDTVTIVACAAAAAVAAILAVFLVIDRKG